LTFDMRGGRQLAKPDVARPLDGRVRRHSLPGPEFVHKADSCAVRREQCGSCEAFPRTRSRTLTRRAATPRDLRALWPARAPTAYVERPSTRLLHMPP